MALVLPDVTLVNAGTLTAANVMSTLQTHFSTTSTKYNVVANGANANGFTIAPVDSNEVWQMNFRLPSAASTIEVMLDPLQNITNCGDGSTAPVLTDDSEACDEVSSIDLSGTFHNEYYVVEMDDAFFILTMNSSQTTNPIAFHGGRVIIPDFTDGVNGYNYADGLGFLSGQPRVSTSTGAGYWLSTGSTTGAIRVGQTGGGPYTVNTATKAWCHPSPNSSSIPATTDRYKTNGEARFTKSFDVIAENAGSSVGRSWLVGRLKYVWAPPYDATTHPQASAGTTYNGADFGTVRIDYTTSSSGFNAVIPWDRTITPIWG